MPLATNETLGNYRLESLLGSGGMGHVYRAVHVHLRQPVAIKVLHPQFAADPDFRGRFLKEAQATAGLEHPNIIRVSDFGEHAGTLYLVMELVNQGSLRTLLSERAEGRQNIPLKALLALMKQAADGLAFAHTHNQVHGDIKPDNLLLSAGPDGTQTLKICDFGLVRLMNSGVRTIANAIPGTPAYMSPEQVQDLPLDGRSDLYSLGVVLYEVTTGMLPFQANTVTAAVHAHVFMQPLRPCQANPDVSPEVDEIVLRCLTKNPNDRFASASELSAALAAVTRTDSVPVRPPQSAASAYFPKPGPPVQHKPVQMALEKRELLLTPGQSASFRIEAINSGSIVEHVYVDVEGFPREWVRRPERKLQLNPGARGSMPLSVLVPRLALSRAGEYKVELRVHSDEDRQVSESEEVRWTVAPFHEAAVDIVPAQMKASRRATYSVRLTNQGNVISRFSLTARDEQGALTLDFEDGSPTKSNLSVEPGAIIDTKLAAAAPLRWFGSPLSHGLTVDAASEETRERKSANARFIHSALLPRWTIAALLVLLGVLGWLISAMFKPEIGSAITAYRPASPIANQQFSITFAVKRAAHVTSSGSPGCVWRAEQGDCFFPNGLSADAPVHVVASNLFGSAEQDLAVHVAPPNKPHISSFTVTPSSGHIKPGDSARLKWQTDNADDVQIVQIGPVNASGSTNVSPSVTTTYDLVAKKSGADQDTKQQTVVVDAPNPGGGGQPSGIGGGNSPSIKIPDFAGRWIEINPKVPGHPMTLTFFQNGREVRIAGRSLTVDDQGVLKYQSFYSGAGGGTGHQVSSLEQADLVDTFTFRIKGSTLVREVTSDYRHKYFNIPAGAVQKMTTEFQRESGAPAGNNSQSSPGSAQQSSQSQQGVTQPIVSVQTGSCTTMAGRYKVDVSGAASVPTGETWYLGGYVTSAASGFHMPVNCATWSHAQPNDTALRNSWRVDCAHRPNDPSQTTWSGGAHIPKYRGIRAVQGQRCLFGYIWEEGGRSRTQHKLPINRAHGGDVCESCPYPKPAPLNQMEARSGFPNCKT